MRDCEIQLQSINVIMVFAAAGAIGAFVYDYGDFFAFSATALLLFGLWRWHLVDSIRQSKLRLQFLGLE
jgi:hypothetical protein